MGEMIDFVKAGSVYVMIGLVVLTLILLVYCVMLSGRLKSLTRRREARLEQGRAEDIIDCLMDQSRVIEALDSRTRELMANQSEMSKALTRCFRSVGIVRFNAFDDVGGEQSWSLAMLDENRNGIIVSSLYGRQDSRLYAKSVVNGEGDRALSDEERRALEKALQA